MLYLEEDCNLRCTYCFVDKKPRRMTSETARKAVEWFLSRHISGAEELVNINFFGGEPFLALDRMEEVVDLCRELAPGAGKRLTFSATTNGTIAGPRVEQLLRRTRMSLLLSLDGTREANRQRPFRSGRESYSVVARNLPRLVEWAGDMVVRMTFTPETIDLVGNVRHALELGAPAVALCPVLECNWAAYQAELEEAYLKLGDWLLDELRENRVQPLTVTWEYFRQLDRVRRFGAGRPGKPCNVGTGLLAVDPDGNVMPCHRFLYRRQDWLGTVDSTDLSDQRWPYVHLVSRDLLGCDACPAEKLCGGGCRVVVLNSRRPLNGIHPDYCVTMRAHARMVESLYDALQQQLGPKFPHFRPLHQYHLKNPALAELARVG
jgi:uncharacterized protein